MSEHTKKKLLAGELTKLDLDVSRIIYDINKGHNITSASFERALDLNDQIIILTKGNTGILIGKKGKIVSQLSYKLGKKVIITKCSNDIKETITELITPAKLLGVNEIFSKQGKIIKIRINKPTDWTNKSQMTEQTLKMIVKSLYKNEPVIVFE